MTRVFLPIAGDDASKGLGVVHVNGNMLSAYSHSGDSLVRLATIPDTIGGFAAGGGKKVDFTADGTYMAVTDFMTPFIRIYKRTGGVFTKLSDPASLPAGIGTGVSFSDDGLYLAVSHDESPFMTVYSRSGDTFTKLSNPSTLPYSHGTCVSFSAGATYLAVGSAVSGFLGLAVYKRSGSTLTNLFRTDFSNKYRAVAFSPDTVYLATGLSQESPFIAIYQRSVDTFSKLSSPSSLPTGIVYDAAWSPDGTYLAFAHENSPYITIYSRSGSTFTKLSNPASLPTGTGRGVAFSENGAYLAVAHSSSPYITIYSRSGSTFTKIANPTSLPEAAAYGVAFWPRPY